jgi:hypothetical protein
LRATEDKDIHHEAVVEHDGAKQLIAQIQGMSPDDDYFDAKVTVLSEMIKHHVKEEEKPGGMNCCLDAWGLQRQVEPQFVALVYRE